MVKRLVVDADAVIGAGAIHVVDAGQPRPASSDAYVLEADAVGASAAVVIIAATSAVVAATFTDATSAVLFPTRKQGAAACRIGAVHLGYVPANSLAFLVQNKHVATRPQGRLAGAE